MANNLNIADLFRRDAERLRLAREDAKLVHPTDIRAAGNQVEAAVRDYLRRMLPPRYYVTHGHLIDSESRVSPQIDVIIADNLGLPSLFTTNDGTEYVPVTSVYAIGEVKSAYYKRYGYYGKMRDDLRKVGELNRPLIENTAFGGIKGTTRIAHSLVPNNLRHLNNLYSFLFCVDSGDFRFEQIKPLLASEDREYLPNTAVFLNSGFVAYGKPDERGGVMLNKYPNEVSPADYDWCFIEAYPTDKGSLAGSHLAYLYGALIEHLTNSYPEPPSVYSYTAEMSGAQRSKLLWAKENTQSTA